MKEDSANLINTVLQSPSVAKTVAGGTLVTSGVNQFVPAWAQDPTMFAAIAGGVLSVVLIISNIIGMRQRSRLDKLEREKVELEIEQLKREAQE